jgi:hypothetical protein
MISFSLGLNEIMSGTIENGGNLLYLLRKPFDLLEQEKDILKDKLELALKFEKPLVDDLKKTLLKHKLILYLAKPFFTCITCFASVWGASVFISLNGFNESLLPYLIIACVSSAYIQTAIYVKVSI